MPKKRNLYFELSILMLVDVWVTWRNTSQENTMRISWFQDILWKTAYLWFKFIQYSFLIETILINASSVDFANGGQRIATFVITPKVPSVPIRHCFRSTPTRSFREPSMQFKISPFGRTFEDNQKIVFNKGYNKQPNQINSLSVRCLIHQLNVMNDKWKWRLLTWTMKNAKRKIMFPQLCNTTIYAT